MKYVNDNPANGIAFTRPMCPYPQQARCQGFGSTMDAANFVCVRRSRQQWPIIADFNTRDTDLGYFDCHFPIAQGYRGRCAVTRNTLEGSRVLPDQSEVRPRTSP